MDADGWSSAMQREGVARDLALRVYYSRLLGCAPVGCMAGGNTAVQTVRKDLSMRRSSALRQGQRLGHAAIEPAGLPEGGLESLTQIAGRAEGAKCGAVKVHDAGDEPQPRAPARNEQYELRSSFVEMRGPSG